MAISNMANCGDNYMDGQRLRCRRPPPHQHLRAARRIDRGQGRHGRIAESYGALIEYLVSQCRRHGVAIHLGAIVKAIDADRRRITVHCDDGAIFEAAAAILPVPLPVLRKSCCLRRRARRRQLVPTSASAMSSKFCCASPQGGGLITAGETSSTCRFCVPTRPPDLVDQHPAGHAVLDGLVRRRRRSWPPDHRRYRRRWRQPRRA